jgi:isopentenyl-diphosphate Delta-isomerase
MSKDRKQDHLKLAELSQISGLSNDKRFNYEPLFSSMPDENFDISTDFLGKKLSAPILISSITGGTKNAKKINENLARVAAKFGLGLGLGSCRPLLEDSDALVDFNMRAHIGKELPMYANLGVHQIDELLRSNNQNRLEDMIGKIDADGLIVHINPMQEYMQPEGDHISESPIKTIEALLDKTQLKLIIKEVGQGFGPKSLECLMNLPLEAIEFGSFGGTNFLKLEELRAEKEQLNGPNPLAFVGHTAKEMIENVRYLTSTSAEKFKCRNFIISGGVQNFLDGYYLMEMLKENAIYGQAYNILKYADDYEKLESYLKSEIDGLKMAKAFLTIKE